MTPGRATAAGTARFASRFPQAEAHGFFRTTQGLTLSTLGLGTYLGDMTDAADEAYVAAIQSALANGINVVDTAINYRHQRSERNLGLALAQAPRDAVLVCTKAGFLTPGALPGRIDEAVAGMHCMEPSFLADQIDRSRANLGLDTLDVFYLHNPETQLSHVARSEFDDRLRRAFARLEDLAADGKIGWYGAATYNGFRAKPADPARLSLKRMLDIARSVAGDEHRFRFIQLPVNLAMPEAFTQPHDDDRGQAVNLLEVAVRAGITVVASAALLQARLPDPEHCIQFSRSTPGVSVALVGMGRPEHVAANLAVAAYPPMPIEDYLKLYERRA